MHVLKVIYRAALLSSAVSIMFFGCAKKGEDARNDTAFLTIDFSDVSDWNYKLGANISGESGLGDIEKNFSGYMQAHLRGLPERTADGKARFGLRDVNFGAQVFEEKEREDIMRRLENLTVTVDGKSLSLSDTIGIPGVLNGGWDIMRCITRVMPVMPNTEMRVGDTWEREQSFPITMENGTAEGMLYQLFTLDSIYKNDTGVPVAAFSWAFRYRVSVQDGGAAMKTFPLDGNGNGSAELDLDKKRLLKSQASFEVTHSKKSNTALKEIVHFDIID